LRLWGKILCSKNDYFIAEGISEGQEEGELPPGTDPKGTGLNKFTYFATTDLLNDWTELPLVSAEHIRISRKLKLILSGSLESAVISNPHFPFAEKSLLRAQIARISFHC
jgi:radial spoke head protein 4/6